MNNDKVFIEDYKNQSIYYDIDDDKFTCEILIEDRMKVTNRKSLKDVRDEINKFIKLNLNFKPFKFILKSRYSGDEYSICYAHAIRSDGKLVVNNRDDGSGSKTFLSLKEIKEKAFMFSQEAMDVKAKFEKSIEDLHKLKKEAIALMTLKLTPLDISEFQYLLNPDAVE